MAGGIHYSRTTPKKIIQKHFIFILENSGVIVILNQLKGKKN